MLKTVTEAKEAKDELDTAAIEVEINDAQDDLDVDRENPPEEKNDEQDEPDQAPAPALRPSFNQTFWKTGADGARTGLSYDFSWQVVAFAALLLLIAQAQSRNNDPEFTTSSPGNDPIDVAAAVGVLVMLFINSAATICVGPLFYVTTVLPGILQRYSAPDITPEDKNRLQTIIANYFSSAVIASLILCVPGAIFLCCTGPMLRALDYTADVADQVEDFTSTYGGFGFWGFFIRMAAEVIILSYGHTTQAMAMGQSVFVATTVVVACAAFGWGVEPQGNAAVYWGYSISNYVLTCCYLAYLQWFGPGCREINFLGKFITSSTRFSKVGEILKEMQFTLSFAVEVGASSLLTLFAGLQGEDALSDLNLAAKFFYFDFLFTAAFGTCNSIAISDALSRADNPHDLTTYGDVKRLAKHKIISTAIWGIVLCAAASLASAGLTGWDNLTVTEVWLLIQYSISSPCETARFSLVQQQRSAKRGVVSTLTSCSFLLAGPLISGLATLNTEDINGLVWGDVAGKGFGLTAMIILWTHDMKPRRLELRMIAFRERQQRHFADRRNNPNQNAGLLAIGDGEGAAIN